ncbi:Snakin-2 [Sesamum alatum]|uniref:Snakin-2 n=1 Tax=Sesamum alatum TaxID=300844 RepID=A0AAE1Y620_9LAMI|nr:Snakin-2 [Sesamum alatum]
MAIAKLFVASIFLSLLFFHQVQAIHSNQLTTNAVSETSYKPKIDCGGACAARCKLSSRPRLCKRACGTCCARCNCVPPGTYGNLELCPCYANMTTHHNKRKCP